MTNTASKLAAGWAAAYGTLALIWTATGRGFPFGPGDPGRSGSPLRNLDPAIGAPVLAATLLLTAVALLVMRGWDAPRGPARAALLGYLWLVVVALLIVVPDVRLLTLAGYLPILLVGEPFGLITVDYAEVFTWTLANQVVAVLGGLLLARAVLRWQFRTAGACERCGRDDRDRGWTTRRAAARWGRWATFVAAAVPLLYATPRLAWAAGIPLGIPSSFLAEMQRTGMVWAGAGLGGFALAGAILTLGLTQRWGEVFPRWMIGLSGKRVPIRLATVPATLVAIFVMSAFVGFAADLGRLTDVAGEPSLATLPIVTWPLWSVALAAATLAYHLRRRPMCPACGRGESLAGVVRGPQAGAY
jgi:hypothetical protein